MFEHAEQQFNYEAGSWRDPEGHLSYKSQPSPPPPARLHKKKFHTKMEGREEQPEDLLHTVCVEKHDAVTNVKTTKTPTV